MTPLASFPRTLMLRQAQHEGFFFGLTLSLSKGEARTGAAVDPRFRGSDSYLTVSGVLPLARIGLSASLNFCRTAGPWMKS